MTASDPVTSSPDGADPVVRAVRAVQRGDDVEAHFRFLYLSFFRPLLSFFRRRGVGPDEARDLTQETFLGIYKNIGGYRHEARFESWLYRIAETTLLKRWRAASTGKRDGATVPVEEAPAAAAALRLSGGQLDRMLDEERRAALHRAVGELPVQQRRCLTLRLERGLGYREIAVLMKLEVETVKAHLARARKELRRRLGPAVEEADREAWPRDQGDR